jgi:hypothetical protein
VSKLAEHLAENPSAWVWFGFFLIAAYLAYHFDRHVERVCDLTSEVRDIYMGPPINTKQAPAVLFAQIKKIEQSGTPEGRLALWQQTDGKDLADICSGGDQ